MTTTLAAKSPYLGWLASAMGRDQTRSCRPAVTPQDLVLGYATGYDAADIAPFVRSLRSVHAGPCVLVVDDRPDVAALLAEHGVRGVVPETPAAWEPHPVMARFAAFDRLLGELHEARHVLLTDVRDVIFQGALFLPAPERLETFVEFEEGRLGDHAFNMKYLGAVGGEDLAQALADRPCLCVGTVLGPRTEVVRFCRLIMMLGAIPRSEIGGAFGADQAGCNLAVHLGLVEADVRPNYGRVATLGHTRSDALSWREGRVINPDGGWSAVVHQHDRHPEIARAVHERWGSGLEHRQRVRPRTAGDRLKKMQQSLRRRLPELR